LAIEQSPEQIADIAKDSEVLIVSKGARKRAARIDPIPPSTSQKSGSKLSVVVSILSLLFSMTALGFTYLNYWHQQKEELLVSLSGSLDNEILVDQQDIPSSSFGGLLYARHPCLLANTGDRPLAVTSIETYVEVRKGFRIAPLLPPFQPISLKPGETKQIKVDLHYPVGKKAIEVLARKNLLTTRVDRLEVARTMAQEKIDLQGEPVKLIVRNPANEFYERNVNRTLFTHCVSVHTARGKTFSNCVQFDPG
jgi:hypothetical protein